jgi:hypothetical protein
MFSYICANMNYFSKTIYLFISVCLLNGVVYAQKQRPIQSGSTYAKLIEATKQTFLPGMRNGTPTEKQAILIIWKCKQAPETFFWRGDDGWAACSVLKVHRSKNKSPKYEFGETWYETSEIKSLSKIRRGDTLELTPVYGGKYQIPAAITDDMQNRVFFYTSGTGWLYLQVKSFIQRPKVAMP